MVLNFMDSGHDIILVVDTSTPNLIHDIVVECEVDFDEDPIALVIDHTSYVISKIETNHALIVSNDVIDSNVILGDKRLENTEICLLTAAVKSLESEFFLVEIKSSRFAR